MVYGCTIWGNMLRQGQIKKLQKLQNKCIELITGKGATTKNYQSLKLLRVADYKIAVTKPQTWIQSATFTTPRKHCRSDTDRKSPEKAHKYQTCRKSKLNHPKPKCDWYHTSFLSKSIVNYQALPLSIRNISHYSSFITSCKTHLLNSTH